MSRKIFFFSLLLLIAVIISFDEPYQNDSNADLNQKIEIKDNPLLNNLDPSILKLGSSQMLKHKIVIAGITRDNGKDLPVSIKYIEHLGSFFKDYRVILFENDSQDNSKSILKIWSESNKKVKIISQNFFIKKRISHSFLAKIRNYYLNEFFKSEYDDFDMLIVVDLDMKAIDVRGVQSSFAQINQWEAVCSNGVKNDLKMYDAFAFRSKEFPWSMREWHKICANSLDTRHPSCKEHNNKNIFYKLLSFRLGWQKDTRLYWLYIVPQIQKKYPINGELEPVSSCFGGMAIYKRRYIKDCTYQSNENDCEHVEFHNCLINTNNGRMFLNPAQVINYNIN
jgi:hypothetical protein